MSNTANCWPTPEQNLLLKAGLLADKTRAKAAWQEYCQKVDLQTADYVSTTFFPLVYHNFKESNSPELITCKSAYRHNWTANHLQFFKLNAALVHLQKAGIKVCILKGAAMIAKYYQDAGLRTMGDIDVLVPRTQVKRTIQLLKEVGWEPLPAITDEQLERILIRRHALLMKNKEGSMLDLHWAVFLGCAIDKALAQYTYRTCRIILPQNKLEVGALSPEDQVMHTILHGVAYSPQPLIRWLPDITVVLNTTPAFDWEYFFTQARQLKLEFFTHTALRYIHEHQFVELPEVAIRRLEEYRPTREEARYFKLITQKPKKFIFIVQVFWSYHVRNSASQNPFFLALTLPNFLKKFWQLKHWHQFPIFLTKRIFFHLWTRPGESKA